MNSVDHVLDGIATEQATEAAEAKALTAADVLRSSADTPAETPAATPPLMGVRRQLDILARQLLAQRKGLELQLDQLDAVFSVVAGLQASADMAIAAATAETPSTTEPERPTPRTFGAKRREADAARADSETPASQASPRSPTHGGTNAGQ